jgi:NADH-quinone oxidoreductase subunit J
MHTAFLILGTVTLLSATAAMSLRNLVHCALCGAITFLGLAGTFLLLQAEFVAFAQVLVYVGAVAILIVIAILLTRRPGGAPEPLWFGPPFVGVGVAVLALAAVLSSVLASPAARKALPPDPEASVRQIGDQLMTRYVLPLEVLGLLLTAALIGAVLLAMREASEPEPADPAADPRTEGGRPA